MARSCGLHALGSTTNTQRSRQGDAHDHHRGLNLCAVTVITTRRLQH